MSSFLVFPLDPTEIERLYGGPAEVTAITGVFRFDLLSIATDLLIFDFARYVFVLMFRDVSSQCQRIHVGS